MFVRHRIKAALLGVSMLGLVACGSEPVDPAAFDHKVQRLVDEGDMYGELFATLKDHRPELYNDFRTVALQAYGEGYGARDSGYLAARRLRSKFVNEILELSKVASDAHVREMISVMIETYEYLNEQDPDDCMRNIEGRPLENVTDIPRDLRKRELRLIVDLMNAPRTVANRRAASLNEVTNWIGNVSTLEPSVARMATLLERPQRGKAENQEVCLGMITLYKRLSYKQDESRGTLFRGMALMVLQQRLLEDNARGEDTA